MTHNLATFCGQGMEVQARRWHNPRRNWGSDSADRGAGVCLKGRALWGQTQSGYKAVGARCKIGWGQSLAVGNAGGGGGGIGVADVPSGRVEGGALGGGGPLPSSKALQRGWRSQSGIGHLSQMRLLFDCCAWVSLVTRGCNDDGAMTEVGIRRQDRLG